MKARGASGTGGSFRRKEPSGWHGGHRQAPQARAVAVAGEGRVTAELGKCPENAGQEAWRTGRDSNPRCPCEARTFSKGVLSTTQPPILGDSRRAEVEHSRRGSSTIVERKSRQSARGLNGRGCRGAIHSCASCCRLLSLSPCFPPVLCRERGGMGRRSPKPDRAWSGGSPRSRQVVNSC